MDLWFIHVQNNWKVDENSEYPLFNAGCSFKTGLLLVCISIFKYLL